MKEIIVRIPEESSELVTQLLEKLGAEISEKRSLIKKAKVKKTTKKSPVKKKKIIKKFSPTFLFGKWKELDIDPIKLREESWGRKY